MTYPLPAECLTARTELVASDPGPQRLDRVAAERHVATCEACHRFVAREMATAAALRAAAEWERDAAPPPRVRAPLAPGAPGTLAAITPRRRLARSAIGAAAALLLAGTLATLLITRKETAGPVGAIFADHAKYLTAHRPADVLSSDPAAIAAWSRSELGWAPRLVRPAGYDLLGARRCTIAGNTAALVFYQRGQRRVSLLVGNASRWPELPPQAALGDMALISGVHDNLVYVAVGDLDAAELAGLLPGGPAT
jgi:anti-sigma factor RsiW